jgi:hypothetical protein
LCGGDRADGEGRHGEHDVAGQRGVEANLGVVEPEAVLAELEILLHRPTQTCHLDQGSQADGPAGWDVTVVVGQFSAGQVFADQQVVA